MKTVVFSDTHLSSTLEAGKFEYLTKIIEDADRVIINGDFWDCFDTTFDNFLNSDWQKLFPLLKQKNTIYLHGNHDPMELTDERILRFCRHSGEKYEFMQNGVRFVVMHGHRIIPSIEKKYPWLVNPLFNTFRHLFQIVGIGLFGYLYFRVFKPGVKYIKSYAKNRIPQGTILVCGHTHFSRFKPKEGYIITGTIDYGFAEHLEIDEYGMRIVQARYKV